MLVLAGIGYYTFTSSRGGILVLDTSPDIELLVNGQKAIIQKDSRGMFVSAYPGIYRLKLTKANYQPFSLDVTVGRGEVVGVRPAYVLLPNSQETDVSTIDYVSSSADQKSLLYLGNNRQTIYRYDIAQNQQIPLTDQPLRNVNDIQWSTDPTVALITMGGSAYLHEIPTYDFHDQILLRLGGGELISPIWDPSNDQRLAFAYFTPTGERSLIFADKNLKSLTRKADLSQFTNPKLVWSDDSQYIAIINHASNPADNDLWIYTTADGTLNKITIGGGLQNATFSPDGRWILYQTASNEASNPFHATLTLSKPDGTNKMALSVPGTVAQAAWKDASSFFLPDIDHNALVLHSVDGSVQTIPFSLSDTVNIQGMTYFVKSNKLVFYTHQAIYTVDLSQ